jgi:hypothetical protein
MPAKACGVCEWQQRTAERRESTVTSPVLRCLGLKTPLIVIPDDRGIDPGLWRKAQAGRCGGAAAERQSLEIGSG